MNQNLTNQIIRHIFDGLGVSPTHQSTRSSFLKKEYLLNQKILFEESKQNIWGIRVEIEKGSFLQILVADCRQNNFPEYAVLVALSDVPSYAAYLSYDEFASEDTQADRPLVACKINNNPWVEASVYMQGSFLCGMEKMKDAPSSVSKIKDESIAEELISFVKFYQDKMEYENEGQEIE